MTVNKLTYPAKENAVQEKINEIIDNLGTSITVDQTYNGTSANPQSGVAIEGELSTNYQTKLVSGTNIKTINNTSLLGSGDIDTTEIFIATYGTTTYNSILNEYNAGKKIYCKNFNTTFDALIPLATYFEDSFFEFIGLGSYTSVVYSFQCNKTNNTWTTSSTSLLPKSAIDTTINSSSTDSRVPSSKCVYNNLKNKADTTLSNVSSIDSNSAVQTALDGKVSKSGDTMTGMLNISKDSISESHFINLVNENITKGTNPAQDTYTTISFNDRTNDSSYLNTRMGYVECSVNANDGAVRMTLAAMKNEVGANIKAKMQVLIDSSGNASCTFPNTNCVDGQWVNSYAVVLESGTSLNGSTYLQKRIPVPNDGNIYEVLLCSSATTGTTSGNIVRVNVSTNQLNNDVLICSTRTRTSSSVGCQGSVIVPVKGVASNLTNCSIERTTSINGTAVIQMIAYRRVGTNA